ncbi:hypothetical protein CsSME_00011027 [Camellia sinensis var. sinensis]
MERIELCKLLNLKVALVTNGAFGNGLPIVYQRELQSKMVGNMKQQYMQPSVVT